MERLDADDKRRPYVQIAASIRAAILSGELEPGGQLPNQQELAKFFGVSGGTVHSAVRVLREEGFVRADPSGTYVTEEASLPVPEGTEHPLAGTAAFLFEMGKLKVLPRSGWFHLGIERPEDVAAHSFRAAMVGIVLASMSGADPGRTSALCIVHDTQETRTGDIDAIGRGYVTVHDAEAITARQVEGLVPGDAAKLIAGLVAEYEANETAEAQLAHDADKLELILQADEYAAQGYDSGPWRETALPALRTDAAKQLARAISATPPAAWYLGHRAAYERRWLRRPGNDAYLNEGQA
jgi:5'-deoxynucleotidase YfbR-like HD superfamily hydrolase